MRDVDYMEKEYNASLMKQKFNRKVSKSFP